MAVGMLPVQHGVATLHTAVVSCIGHFSDEMMPEHSLFKVNPHQLGKVRL